MRIRKKKMKSKMVIKKSFAHQSVLNRKMSLFFSVEKEGKKNTIYSLFAAFNLNRD